MNIYVAVNEDGTELISNKILFRAEPALQNSIDKFDPSYEMYRYKCKGVWADDYSTGYYNVPIFTGTVLPKGTIEKLTGVKLTWDDDYLIYEI